MWRMPSVRFREAIERAVLYASIDCLRSHHDRLQRLPSLQWLAQAWGIDWDQITTTTDQE